MDIATYLRVQYVTEFLLRIVGYLFIAIGAVGVVILGFLIGLGIVA